MTANPPIKYVTDHTPPPSGYCPVCWSTRRVIPLRRDGSACWVCAGIAVIHGAVEAAPAESAFEIEAPPAQASLELDVP